MVLLGDGLEDGYRVMIGDYYCTKDHTLVEDGLCIVSGNMPSGSLIYVIKSFDIVYVVS